MILASTITAPSGELNLEAGAYELEKDTMSEVAVTWRKQEVDNAWVEGSFIVGAVRSTIVRPLNVWVTSTSRATYETARDLLIDAIEQLSWTWTFSVDGNATTWRCQMADYSLIERHEYLHAYTGLVRASVPTQPTAIA